MSGYVVQRTMSVPDRSFTLVHTDNNSGRAAILAHAYGSITGALVDFMDEIEASRTSAEAISIAKLLRELAEKVGAMEDLALAAADRLSGGNAA